MSLKKFILGAIIFTIIIVLGFISVNIETTKALSPTGDGADNYAMVSKEFGKDFEEFIRDNAMVKIYVPKDDDDNTTIKVYNNEFRVKKENPFVKGFYEVVYKFSNSFNSIKNKIDGKLKKNNENTNNQLDNIVDDFIKEREEEKSQNKNIKKEEKNINKEENEGSNINIDEKKNTEGENINKKSSVE